MIKLRQKSSPMVSYIKSAFLVLCILMTFGQVKASLSGTYTIDPSKSASSTNYVSFNDAVDDLLNGKRSSGTANGPGVSKAVIFDVAKGIYEEQIALTSISGASASNTITFQSASGKNTDVTMIDTSNASANNYLISLDGATHLAFKNMTLSRNSNQSGFVIYTMVISLLNGSDSNTFTGNNIIGFRGANYYFQQALVNSFYTPTYSFTQDQGNLFDNNYLKYGSYCFFMAGTFSANDSGNVITNNVIDSFYYGNQFYYQSGFTFSNNTMKNQTSNFGYGIISFYGDKGIKIQNNNLDLTNGGGYGIYLGYTTCDSANPLTISNNMVTMKGANAYYGIYSYNNAYTEIISNNILHEGSNSYNYAVYIGGYSTSINYLINNNIYESGSSGALYYQSGYLTDEDYNNIYGPSSGSLISVSGTVYSTIAAHTTATGFGNNDLSSNPRYASINDLHVSNVKLNGAAKSWISNASILKDFDGQTRSTTKPDIGADEFFPPLVDGEISSIDSPTVGFCAGSKNIYVKFFNAGLGSITSATIDWSINGTAQTAAIFSGSLASGQETLIKLGTSTLSGSGGFTIKADLTTTNTQSPDSNTSNNSKSFTYYVGLSGTYTVGGTSPSFSNFTDAADAINKRGLCTSTTFDVRDGVYSDQFEIDNITGSSATKTVTFRSVSGNPYKCVISVPATTTPSTKDYIVYLKGADYITFKQIGFERPYSSPSNYGTAYQFDNGAHFNTVDSCQFNIPSQAYPNAAIYSGSGTDSFNTFKNNMIVGGYFSIFVSGNYGVDENTNLISKNQIDSYYYAAIYSQYQKNGIIDKNTIRENNYPYGYGYGIYAYYNSGATKITNNYINMPLGGYGILTYFLGGGVGTKSGSSTSLDTGLVANNQIYIGNNTTYTFGVAIGIYAGYPTGANFYHNSILNESSLSSTGSNAAFASYAFSSSSFYNVQNNAFANTGNGLSIYLANSTSLNTIDYNDYYFTGANLGYLGTNASTLADFQALTSQDANSFSADPKFISPPNNLRTKSSKLAGKGKYFGPEKDYYDTLRSKVAPTIGANEITQNLYDATVSNLDSPSAGFCAGTKNIYVTFANTGLTTITSATIKWSVNGTTYAPYYYSSASGLKSNKDTVLKLGTFTFANGVSYLFKSKVDSMINGKLRPLDTATNGIKRNIASSLNGTYTIGTKTGRNYSSIVDAAAALNSFGVCGPVVFNIDTDTYVGSFNLNKIVGASSINTITFNGDKKDSTKVIITDASTSYGQAVITMNSVKYVTFNNVYIWNTGSSSGNSVNFQGGSSYNNFNSSQLRVSYQYAYPLFSQQDVDEYNTFDKVHFASGYYGVYFSSGFTFPYVYEKSNRWLNCKFDSAYYAGVLLYFQDSFQIKHSVVDNIQYPYSGAVGIYLYYTQGMFDISRNYIHQSNGGYGIYSFYLNGSTTDSAYIANNFVSIEGPGTGYQSAGFYNYYMKYVNIYHNSFNVSDPLSNSFGLTTKGNSGTDNYIINNIFDCDNGTPMDIDGTITYSDYNDFYAATSGNVAALSGTAYTTLSDWQIASGFDAKGLNIDPSFKSITDLHASAGGLVSGTPLSMITVDYDNQKRSSTRPVIGADEFAPKSDDATFDALVSPIRGGCGDSNVVITANVSNAGTKSSINFPVRYRIYKGATLIDSGSVASGTISAGVSTLINFSATKKLNTYSGGTYSLLIYTDYNLDLDRTNDTSRKSFYFYPHFGNPTTTSITSCGGGSKSNVLRAKAFKKGDNLVWTDISGKFLTKGDSFVSSATKSTVYFVQAQSDTFFVGEDGNTISGTSSNTPTGSKFGLEFDALKDVVIDSVDVIASASGNVTFTVYDGTTIIGKSTAAVSGSGSLERVPVKIKVPTGSAYQILVSGTSIAAYYDNSGYPYSYVSRGIEITNGIYYGSTNSNSYTGLFNWQVSDTDACPSQKVPAALIIGTGGKPNASFTTSNNCSNDSLKITDNSTISTGSITGGVVSFGDGTFGKIATVGGSIYHKYPKSGSYKVTYAVSGSGGCVDDTTLLVSIASAPRAYFYTSSQKCVGDSITFFDTTYSATTYTRTFDFNGVRVSTSSTSARYAFSGSGPYTAKLIVVAKNGCTDSTSKTFKLNAAPSLKIVVDSASLCTPSTGIKFSADTTNGYNSTYSWTFGDGTSNGSGQAVTHTYAKNGSYTLQLSSVSAAGCKSNILTTKLVNVQPLPVATFKAKLNGSKTFDFTANDTTAGNTYTWQFGDINSGSGRTVSHTYASTGKFIAELKVTNINNCSVNDTNSVIVVGIDANGNAPSNSLAIYPNPFLNKTNINYSIVERQKVTVDVIDITGRLVVRLVDATQNQGTFNVSFDREVYNALPGVYLVKITLGNKVITKEITSVR